MEIEGPVEGTAVACFGNRMNIGENVKVIAKTKICSGHSTCSAQATHNPDVTEVRGASFSCGEELYEARYNCQPHWLGSL